MEHFLLKMWHFFVWFFHFFLQFFFSYVFYVSIFFVFIFLGSSFWIFLVVYGIFPPFDGFCDVQQEELGILVVGCIAEWHLQIGSCANAELGIHQSLCKAAFLWCITNSAFALKQCSGKGANFKTRGGKLPHLQASIYQTPPSQAYLQSWIRCF